MTEKQKKIAIIVGVIVIAVFLLWMRKGSAGTTIINQEELPPINVSIPGFNIPERGDIVINVPALPSGSQYGFNAISPCMCNGQSTSGYDGPLFNFTLNEAGRGPNIYNYFPTTVPQDNAFYGRYTG